MVSGRGRGSGSGSGVGVLVVAVLVGVLVEVVVFLPPVQGNNIPLFCPAITDGSIGDMLYFHSYKRSGRPSSPKARWIVLQGHGSCAAFFVSCSPTLHHHSVTILKAKALSSIWCKTSAE